MTEDLMEIPGIMVVQVNPITKMIQAQQMDLGSTTKQFVLDSFVVSILS